MGPKSKGRRCPACLASHGLRFQVSEEYRVHLAVDGAVNLEGDTGLYFRIVETF